MIDWDTIVSSEPGEAGWLEICRRAEGMSDGEVAEMARRLREWPDRLRHMPDRWWAQRQAGDHRPWHRLATHRRLCQLGDYFYVSVAACPDDLSLLLAGSGATSNSDLGAVMLLRPTAEIETTDPADHAKRRMAAALTEQAKAIDGQFSPDGSHVVVGFSDVGDPEWVEGPYVYNADGGLRFSFGLGGSESFGTNIFDDMNFVRIGQNGDGRLAAGGNPAGGVAVAEAATGLMLLSADGATGPVALDQVGTLVAYACPSGQVAIRDVGSGELLSTASTGLPTVNALAFSPDGRGLVAAGGHQAAASLVTLDHGRLEDMSTVTVADPEFTMDATSPFASFATRACWTGREPQVFAACDYRAVLFNGSTGQVRWTSSVGQVTGSFTPDGRTLIASAAPGVINAWFLDSLSTP